MAKSFGTSIHARNFGNDVSVRPTVQTVGKEVGREDSLRGRECSGNFPWQEIAWQRSIWQPTFFRWKIILVTSNEIKSRKHHKRRGDEICQI